MSLPVGTILRVVATAAWLDGNLNQNVYNAVLTGSGGPFDEDDLVQDALDWVETMYANLVTTCSDEIDGSQVQVYNYDAVDDDWDEIGSTGWVWDPTSSGDQLPRGVAGLLNAKTMDPDISGKKYVGGLTEGSATDGLISAATLVLLGDYGDDWVTAFVGATSGADWTPGVWSVVNTLISVFAGTNILPLIPAYQRRRKRGVGV